MHQFVNFAKEPGHITSTNATFIDMICTDAPLSELNVNHRPELGCQVIVVAEFEITLL